MISKIFTPVLSQTQPQIKDSDNKEVTNSTKVIPDNGITEPKDESSNSNDNQLWLFVTTLSTLFLGGATTYLTANAGTLKQSIARYIEQVTNAQEELDETKDELDKTKDELDGLTRPVQVTPDETVNSVMTVGLGGSGKTSLVKALIGGSNRDIDPLIKTRYFRIYSTESATPVSTPQKISRLYISDYPGQTLLEDLIRGFIKQQSLRFSPLRYNHVISLILVVDLYPPSDMTANIISEKEKLDRERAGTKKTIENRIEENVNAWNESAISAIFGMMTSSLKYICLFINKSDLVEGTMEEEEIINKYKSILKSISARDSGIKVTVLIGSAKDGKNIITLKDELITYSVSSEEYGK